MFCCDEIFNRFIYYVYDCKVRYFCLVSQNGMLVYVGNVVLILFLYCCVINDFYNNYEGKLIILK